MDNAKNSIKGIANYSIASNDQDGVLEALDWMLKDKNV